MQNLRERKTPLPIQVKKQTTPFKHRILNVPTYREKSKEILKLDRSEHNHSERGLSRSNLVTLRSEEFLLDSKQSKQLNSTFQYQNIQDTSIHSYQMDERIGAFSQRAPVQMSSRSPAMKKKLRHEHCDVLSADAIKINPEETSKEHEEKTIEEVSVRESGSLPGTLEFEQPSLTVDDLKKKLAGNDCLTIQN